jgi:hypothetical protein
MSVPAWPFPKRFVSVFAAPRALFEHLVERPSWFLPLLVYALAVGIFMIAIWNPVVLPEQIAKIEESGRPGAEQAIEMMQGPMQYVSQAVAVVGTAVSVLIYALAVFFIAGFMLGGRLNYRQSLSLVSHACLVVVPGILLRIPLALAAGQSQVSLGPGALLPPAQAEGFGGKFASYFLVNFDVFILWQTALVALGVAVIAKLPPRTANIGIWSVFLAFALVTALLGAAFQR